MPAIKDPIKRERNALACMGCSEQDAIKLNDGLPLRQSGSNAMRYTSQRNAAFRRGVAWEITFPQWLSIWVESGRLDNRGRGASGYCMARHGDVGPYKLSNVSIQTCAQNSSDGIKKASRKISLFNASRLGSGRGWTYRSGIHYSVKPYQVVLAGKYIGRFATQQEAECAHRAAVARRCDGVIS